MTIELILTIAKIVGITLGGILALLLLLILLVLFVPIRYRLHVSKQEQFSAYGKATWLLHILSIKYAYAGKEEGIGRSIRVFGIRIGRKEKTAASDKDSGGGRAIRWDEEPEPAAELPADTDSVNVQKASSESDPESADAGTSSGPVKEDVHRSKEQKGPGIKERVTNVTGKLKRLKGLLESETFRRALSLCKNQLYRAWKAFRPRKIKGYVHFGFEDPSLTGRILGATCIFYAFYGDSLRVIPDFDKQIIEGKLDLKGRIRVITVILIGAKLYFDKDIRSLWAMISKEEK